MSNQGKKVLLYRSDVSGKTPNIDSIATGELALNYNSDSPFLSFKDTNNKIQKIGSLSTTTGYSEYNTMTQKAITEVIEDISYGGYIYIEKYDKENFQNALNAALSSLNDNESAIIDCTYFKGKHKITNGFQINNSVTLIFGNIDIEFENNVGSNMFTFNNNNISIQGVNRNTDKTQVDNGATIFRMKNIDNSLEGYHIKSRGNKNLEIKNVTFVGLRTTMGHQYGNSTYDIDGVGGIYIEKAKPEMAEGGNTCNNIRIENVLIASSKAHGIYIDTPILSTIKNVRLSDCGGHGVFINGGTSVLFENTYVSSSDMAGFCIYGSSYVSLNNCVAENGGIGFWIRSSFNVTMMSPGVEATKNHGANPWRNSQPITGKYGLNISTLSSDGQTVIPISDVNSDASSYFRGYGILISGGKSINIFTPYVKSISQTAINAGYPKGAELSEKVKYINVVDDARAIYILNPSFKENSNSEVSSKIKHEIGIDANVANLELVYNTKQTTLIGTLDDENYVSDEKLRAPIYCKSTNSVIRNGVELITNYQAKSPLLDSELANKEYVDLKLSNIDVKLQEDYVPIEYPTVEETDGVNFIAAKSNDDLNTIVTNLDTNLSTLAKEILKDEKAIAKALTEIKENAGFDINMQYIQNKNANYISTAKSFAEADNLLDNAIANCKGSYFISVDMLFSDERNNDGSYKYVITENTYNEIKDNINNNNIIMIDASVLAAYYFHTKESYGNMTVLNYAIENINTDNESLLLITRCFVVEDSNSHDDFSEYYIIIERNNLIIEEIYDKGSNVTPDVDFSEIESKIETLEQQLATANSTISTLESKINAIIRAVGLNSDGTYNTITTSESSGYTSTATSVREAIILMDNQIEENETVSAYALTDLNNRLENLEIEKNNKV